MDYYQYQLLENIIGCKLLVLDRNTWNHVTVQTNDIKSE